MRKPQGKIKDSKKAKKLRRKLAIRKIVIGTALRPRVCTIKSNKHLVVQVVDDAQSRTLASVQTFGKNAVAKKGNREGGKLVGRAVAGFLKEKKIIEVVLDRNGNIYTGVIAEVANSLREEGIKV